MTVEQEREEALRALLQRSRSVTPIDPARAARVRAAVHSAWVDRPLHTRARRWWLGAVTAAAAAMLAYLLLGLPAQKPTPPVATAQPQVVGAIGFLTSNVEQRRVDGATTSPLGAGDPVTTGSSIVTGADGLGTIVLADGVEVRLDRLTTLTIESGRRFILARGAIYVDTTARRGPPDPLEVMAHDAVVRNLGTRYEVRVSAETTRVRVRDGRVQVSRGGDVREAAGGRQITVDAAGIDVAPAPAFGPDWTWVVRATQAPDVDGRSLADFLAWAQREGGRTIRFADPALEQTARTTQVYGVIDGLTVEEALDVVLPTCGLEHHVDGAVITIATARGRR